LWQGTTSVGSNTFKDISNMFLPKLFPKQSPILSDFVTVSRVLLRKDFVTKWNGYMQAVGVIGPNLPKKRIVLSAAGGLGKSTDLYLTAVFARYCKIPLQYVTNTSALVETFQSYLSQVASRYLKMLLFLNAEILDNVNVSFYPTGLSPDFLHGVTLKETIYFALRKKDIILCEDIRVFVMDLEPQNFLIMDEHNALWREFGNEIRSWPKFFKFYTDFQVMNSVSEYVTLNANFSLTFTAFLWGSYCRFTTLCI
jgi:uncharacterized protein YozE (UPF0346 family)